MSDTITLSSVPVGEPDHGPCDYCGEEKELYDLRADGGTVYACERCAVGRDFYHRYTGITPATPEQIAEDIATYGDDRIAVPAARHEPLAHVTHAHCDVCGAVGDVWDRQGDHGAILCCAKCRDGYELPECPDCAGSGYTREDDGERECIPCHGSGWTADD